MPSVPRAAVLVLGVAFGPARSFRDQSFSDTALVPEDTPEPSQAKPKEDSKGVLAGPGWVCEDLSYVEKKAPPAEVKTFLADLYPTYVELARALAKVPKNWLGAWKGPELSREVALSNHSQVFRAKVVDVFLTLPPDSAKYSLCFAKIDAKLTDTILEERYGDGYSVPAGCGEKHMPLGVVAQAHEAKKTGWFDDKKPRLTFQAEPGELPNEVLRLLTDKGAVDLFAEFAKNVNRVRTASPDWAASITFQYREQFKAKGLGLYYNEEERPCTCPGVMGAPSICRDKHRWVEYVDLTWVRGTYTPAFLGENVEYPASKILAYLQCRATEKVLPILPQQVIVDVRQANQPSEGCGQVLEAIPSLSREDRCKCPKEQQVYCNGTMVAGRKFRLPDIIDKPECKAADMYCAPDTCIHGLYTKNPYFRSGQGWLCMDMDYLQQPGDLYEVRSFMETLDLYANYTALKAALRKTPKSFFGGSWRGSALHKEVALGDYTAPFREKDVEVFLTKDEELSSPYKLCFARPVATLRWSLLRQKYGDGNSVQAGCRSMPKYMPLGVVAQSFDDKKVKTAADELPSEVLRLLLDKNATDLHNAFAGAINSVKTKAKSEWAALTTFSYRGDFQAKGIGLYYNEAKVLCSCWPALYSLCPETHRWFEYADLDIRARSYVPAISNVNLESDARYPVSGMLSYLQCEQPPRHVPKQLFLRLREERSSENRTCSQVNGAVSRGGSWGCKCSKSSHSVYCNGVRVKGRKFKLDRVLRKRACESADMYCASKKCGHFMYSSFAGSL